MQDRDLSFNGIIAIIEDVQIDLDGVKKELAEIKRLLKRIDENTRKH